MGLVGRYPVFIPGVNLNESFGFLPGFDRECDRLGLSEGDKGADSSHDVEGTGVLTLL
jgi:hypothetical protein